MGYSQYQRVSRISKNINSIPVIQAGNLSIPQLKVTIRPLKGHKKPSHKRPPSQTCLRMIGIYEQKKLGFRPSGHGFFFGDIKTRRPCFLFVGNSESWLMFHEIPFCWVFCLCMHYSHLPSSIK